MLVDWELDGLEDYLDLLAPESLEAWWGHTTNPDLLPIIRTPDMGAICLRIPFRPDEPTMWVQRSGETNHRASLGRSFGGVIRVLAAYMDAWSFDCSTEGEADAANALFQRSRRVLTEVRGLMDERQRDSLVRLRFWPLLRGNSPVNRDPKVVIPSFRISNCMPGRWPLKWAEGEFGRALKEDPSFGSGHWAMGVAYGLKDRIEESCSALAFLMEGDLRTGRPSLDGTYTDVYGGPPVADFRFAARFLRSHEAEYRSVSRNRAVASIILGDGFDTMGAWLDGLALCMRDGRYAEAMPIAQSLLASYLDDQWFADDVEQFDACTNALSTIYAAAGLECRVSGVAG